MSSSKVNEGLCLKNIEELLKNAIEYRFVSDVPVGVLLSGGLDSSVVTSISSKIKEELLSFSIGFELEEYSELKYARIVANKFKTISIEDTLDSSKMKKFLDQVLYYFDEPLGVSSIFPTFLLMEITSNHVKVALSGDGGDEVFAGYNWYYNYLKIKKYNFLSILSKLINKLFKKLIPNPKNNFLKGIKRRFNYLALNYYDRKRKL